MHTGPLIDWPTTRRPPQQVMRRLRAVRPNVEVLANRNGTWMLGEVRWNWARYTKGVRILEQFFANRREQGLEVGDSEPVVAFLQEGLLMMQGFVWIGDYAGDLGAEIVDDYARKCFKEDHGLLDADFYARTEESDMKNSLLRRTKLITDRITSEAKSDFAIVMKKRQSFTRRANLAANRARAALLPAPTSRIETCH